MLFVLLQRGLQTGCHFSTVVKSRDMFTLCFDVIEQVITIRVLSTRMDDDTIQGTIKSDKTLLAILNCIREADGARLTDIANSLTIAKSTVHSHLKTLIRAGFIRRTDGRYYLGLMFLDYGIQARNQRKIYEVAQPMTERLAAETGERTWCIVEENYRAVYLCGASADNPMKTPHRVGRHTELHHLAGGKAILAHLPTEYMWDVIRESGLPQLTSNTITNADELLNELATVCDRGVAYNMEESMKGLHAIAAPVMNPEGSINGAVSISGPANRLTKFRMENELAGILRGATNEMEINMRNF